MTSKQTCIAGHVIQTEDGAACPACSTVQGVQNKPAQTAAQSCPGAGAAPSACWGPHMAGPPRLCALWLLAASCGLQLHSLTSGYAYPRWEREGGGGGEGAWKA